MTKRMQKKSNTRTLLKNKCVPWQSSKLGMKNWFCIRITRKQLLYNTKQQQRKNQQKNQPKKLKNGFEKKSYYNY